MTPVAPTLQAFLSEPAGYVDPLSEARGCQRESGGVVRIGSWSSEAFEEVEEGVGGPVAAGFAVEWFGLGECLFLDREVGVEIFVRSLDLLVAEPERDHGGVDAGV
jgi:hypothetical protein